MVSIIRNKSVACRSFQFFLLNSRDYCFFYIKVGQESDDESEIDPTLGDDDGACGGDTLDDTEFVAYSKRKAPKRHWITPRLCSALDKAKVKRMRLKK